MESSGLLDGGGSGPSGRDGSEDPRPSLAREEEAQEGQLQYVDGLLKGVDDEYDETGAVATPAVASLGADFDAGSSTYQSEKTLKKQNSSRLASTDAEGDGGGGVGSSSSSSDSDSDSDSDSSSDSDTATALGTAAAAAAAAGDGTGADAGARTRTSAKSTDSDSGSGSGSESGSGSQAAHAARDFVFCSECGSKMPRETAHCSKCGSALVVMADGDCDGDGDGEDASSSSDSSSDEDSADGADGSGDAYDPFRNVKSLRKIVPPPSPPSPPALAPGAVYEVRFEAGKSGLTFDEDWLGNSMVVDDLPQDDFVAGKNGDGDGDGNGGANIHVGDSVVSINGEACMGLCLERVEDMLREAQQAGRHTVRFRTATRIAEAFGGDGKGAEEARSVIYRQKSAVYEPPDHMDMVYGYVQRFRGEKVVSLHFFREADNKFLLGAVLPRNGKGRIIFHNSQQIAQVASMSDVPVHPESSRYLGCLVNNFAGTAFTVHDYRVFNPTSTRKTVHHELGFVMYETNVLGRVPNSLRAVLPRWDPEQGLKGQRNTLAMRFKQATKTRLGKDLNILQKIGAKKGDEYRAVELDEQEDLLEFDTKKPSWNEDLQAWTLSFNGRVKLASKKNFILVPQAGNEAMDEEFGNTICLRFGKVTKDRFSLDFRHPISPMQALAIAGTSFSTKRLVT